MRKELLIKGKTGMCLRTVEKLLVYTYKITGLLGKLGCHVSLNIVHVVVAVD